MTYKVATEKHLVAENKVLRDQLDIAEESLREILSGEADALFVSGVAGAQIFTLKGANQSYRLLMESMSEGALTLTPEGLVLYANRRFAELLRTPLEKVISSGIETWFTLETRQSLLTLLQNEAVDGRHGELFLMAADGTQVPVYISVSRIHLDETHASLCMVVTDLTNQKRNEAIIAAEKLSGAILEQAADAIVICDESGRIIRVSKQAQALHSKNLLGELFEHAFSLRQLNGTAFALLSEIDTSHAQSLEARLEVNGKILDFLVSVGHLKGAQNQLLGSVITLTDMTAHKQAAQALLETTQRVDGIVMSAMDAIVTVDEEMRIVLNNPAADKMFGYVTGELQGKSLDALIPEHFRAAHSATIAAFGKTGITSRRMGELRPISGVRRNGEEFPIEASISMIESAGQRFFTAIVRDITERKNAESLLMQSQERLKLATESAGIGIWDYDITANKLVWDAQMYVLYGIREQDFSGAYDAWQNGLHPDDVKRGNDAVNAAIEGTGDLDAAFQVVWPNGEVHYIEARATVQRDSEGVGIRMVGTNWDVTEHKNSQTKIAYLNRVLLVRSNINNLIVRVNDCDLLFRESCQIAVNAGEFPMAMLVIVDPVTMLAVSIASSGKQESLLADVKMLMSTSEGMQKTLIGRAVRENQVIISNDIQNDPELLLGKRYSSAEVKSKAVIPLLISGEARGALVLYAREIEFFHKEELSLLSELAGDIAFAVDHIEKQDRLNYLAYYDVLTGLANRNLFLERVSQYMRSAVIGGYQLALFLIDLERFKNINDSLGRDAGDSLLRQTAEWLTRNVGDVNLLARLDADHFAVVLPEVKKGIGVVRHLEKIITTAMAYPVTLGHTVLRVSPKVGVALFPDDGIDADTLFRNAEAALKKAKQKGDRYLFYTSKINEAMADKLTLENQLRHALDNDEFVLHYQPKINLASGKITSVEALIRWNDPRTGLVPPGHFIPILEETGLIHAVGAWALRQASADYLRWRAKGLSAVRIAVNVSSLQLRNRTFIDDIKKIIGVDLHAAEGLEVEITESLIMEDVVNTITSLQSIRAMGVTIAIDDFGTGYSSLSYLAKLPVDTLKIDRSFVTEMAVGREGLALVSTIISLAHSMKLKVVAEGVETEEQSHLLRLLACDEMQGFLISKAIPAEILEARFLTPYSGG